MGDSQTVFERIGSWFRKSNANGEMFSDPGTSVVCESSVCATCTASASFPAPIAAVFEIVSV